MKMLFEQRVPTPASILFRKYGIYAHVFEGQPEDKHYQWFGHAVRTILSNQIYLGHTISFKSGVISYKNQKQVKKPQEEWIVVRDTHEPIISEEQFALVQNLHRNRIRPLKNSSEPHMLAGLVKCSECGSCMRYSRRIYRGKEHETVTESLDCLKYATFGKAQCQNHYINYKVLTELLLDSVRGLAEQIHTDEAAMLKKLLTIGGAENDGKAKQFEAESKKLSKRRAQLEAVFLKLYEDRATGQIADDNYKLLSRNFEKEKSEIDSRFAEINAFLASREQEQTNIERWTQLLKKYRNLESLDRHIANELIEKISIGHAEIADGVRQQKISIYYRFVGDLNGRL